MNRLDREFYRYQDEYEAKALEVLRSGYYILGKEVRSFEEEFAEYTGTKYCVGLASGLDALIIAFHALGIGDGDEVIVQGNAYIASVMGITKNGATPVFVEPDRFYQIDVDRIEEKITEKTKAVLAVHLYGHIAQMEQLEALCKKRNLRLVEDCAQAHGAAYKGRKAGSFGDIACFSFYPTKNMGAFGDGGAVTTDDKSLAEYIRIYRNYGSEKRYHNQVIGVNSRLDELQAGLLRVKLRHLQQIIDERSRIAEKYNCGITNQTITLHKTRKNTYPVWHQYVIQTETRDALMGYLEKNGVGTVVHYPIPPYLSEAYNYLGMKKGSLIQTEKFADEVLSLPIYNGMTNEEVDKVISLLNAYDAACI